MNRRFLLILFVGSLILSFVNKQQTSQAWLSKNATVPTRTPTSQPTVSQPTDTPKGGGGSATSPPGSTPPPSITPTSTVIVTIAYTPVGGFVPTAAPCSSQPTILARNPTNVRQGPGTDYAIVGQLVYLEVRFILGRAAGAPWWLIQLDDGDMGWVADDVVTIEGYIGNVPIISAPEINGDTPTPGTTWNPTPNPFCTVTPTFTPEPSTTLAATPANAEAPASQPETIVEDPVVSATATPPPEPTQTAVAPPTLPPTATNQPEIIDSQPAVPPSSVGETTGGSATDLLLPIVGLLLLAGGITAFVRRNRQNHSSTTPT